MLRVLFFSFLVVWGLYTLIAYLAVPVHQAVLLTETARQAVLAACTGGSVLCMGTHALLPFITHTLGRMQPLLWYGILCLLIYGAVLGAGFFRSGEWDVRIRLTPLKLILFFVFSLWLLFTVLTFGSVEGQPFVRLYDASLQVYANTDSEGIQALQENLDVLKERGCLTQVGTTANGVNAYDMKRTCMQGAFVVRVLPHVVFILFLLFVFLTLGRALLRLLNIRELHALSELIFSAGLGASALIVLLWLLAHVGLYTQLAGWALIVLIPLLFWKHALYWLQSCVRNEWTYEGAWHTGVLILGWLLVSYLAFNFLNVVRPFPIGWDDLGKYINQPRLLVSYGHVIPQLGAFFWEYITSIGFLLFGYGDVHEGHVFGGTSAMLINWSAGLLAVLAVYAGGRLFLGRRRGLLAALLYYALPMVGHFSFADMKVDNAVFFMGALSTLAVYLGLFAPQENEGEGDEEEQAGPPVEGAQSEVWKWMVLAGVLGGFAFAMKPTAVMVLMALGTVLFGVMVHWTAFLGTFLLAWAFFTQQGRLDVAAIAQRVYGNAEVFSRPVFVAVFLTIGVISLAASVVLRRSAWKRVLAPAGIFIGSFLLAIAPWLLWNNIARGNIVPQLLFAEPGTITPTFVIGQKEAATLTGSSIVRVLPTELRVDSSKCGGTARGEELDRYWGYGSGWSHYLTLPWRVVMNADSAGYYVTTYPALLLFPLLLLLPYFWRRKGKWLRWVFIATLFMLLEWIFFANGIIWYGVGMFLGLAVMLEVLVFRSPDIPSKVASSVLVALSLLSAFAMRFWQFEQQRNLFEYPAGKVTSKVLSERTIPQYDNIQRIIEQRIQMMPERPYVYRIGTFIPYFIPRNLEVLPVADHQLDFFNCINLEQDPALTLKRLQALGFNSIIFDTNTQTIEQDPNGSLHQKVQKFVNFVNTQGIGVTIPINDPNAGIAYILLP